MKTNISFILKFLIAACLSLIFLGCGDADYFETDYFIDREKIFFENPQKAIKIDGNNQKNNKELELGEDNSSSFARFYNYRRNTGIAYPTVSSWSYYLDPGIGYPLPLIDHPYYTRAFFSDWLYRYYSY